MNGGRAERAARCPRRRSASGRLDVGHRQVVRSPGALHGTEKAASTSAISRPSCSMRAESVLSERPSRSIAGADLDRPRLGRARVVDRQRARRARRRRRRSRSARAAASPRGSRRGGRARHASRRRHVGRRTRALRRRARCSADRRVALERRPGSAALAGSATHEPLVGDAVRPVGGVARAARGGAPRRPRSCPRTTSPASRPRRRARAWRCGRGTSGRGRSPPRSRGRPSSAFSSARSVSTSRSFVGSSSSSRLPPLRSSLARCTRLRSPPESLPMRRLLVGALEVEAGRVLARVDLAVADLDAGRSLRRSPPRPSCSGSSASRDWST